MKRYSTIELFIIVVCMYVPSIIASDADPNKSKVTVRYDARWGKFNAQKGGNWVGRLKRTSIYSKNLFGKCIDSGNFFLWDFCVKKGSQKQGIGAELICACAAQCWEEALEKGKVNGYVLWNSQGDAATAFYENLGFKQASWSLHKSDQENLWEILHDTRGYGSPLFHTPLFPEAIAPRLKTIFERNGTWPMYLEGRQRIENAKKQDKRKQLVTYSAPVCLGATTAWLWKKRGFDWLTGVASTLTTGSAVVAGWDIWKRLQARKAAHA